MAIALCSSFTAANAVAAPSQNLSAASASLDSTTTTPTPEATPTPVPTAVFSSAPGWGGVRLNLPAAPSSLLAVGFHQASGKKVLRLTPVSRCLRIYKYSRTKGLLRSMRGIKMFQQELRWRHTSNFSAADCAVKPKSVILAPVTGTVTMVKNYKLYGRYPDVQLEILPDGASARVRVVVLHIQGPKVKVGDRVTGGVTPIAMVRHFRFVSAVNRYLPTKSADHTHLQINYK